MSRCLEAVARDKACARAADLIAAAFATFAAVTLIATTTFGRVEPQPTPAQLSPLQMMNAQHLQQTEMTDMSLVFER